ncbi:MAG: OmpA family protein [Paracoccaceae bacterium]|jgi:OOP family OmpA-OmpF porin|nr:OmpA family protein [Paracoccaceae bacterium]
MRRALLSALVGMLTGAAPAQEAFPPLPPLASLVVDSAEAPAAVRLPVTVWQAGEVQTIRAEGAVHRRVWQIPQPGLTPAQLMAPIRDALEGEGYAILLDCAAAECGGFEFRFATDALPPPDMYVDLGRYRYLSAQNSGADGERWRAVMVSATPARGFVQVTAIGPEGAPGDGSPAQAASPRPPGDLGRALAEEGRVVLWDVAFETGATALGAGGFASIEALARWLGDNPAARVALVGHTDAEGGLAANIDLSRRRAAAVRDRLVAEHGIAPERLSAEGVGWLAPRTTNATEAGREANRRVEAVVADR